MLMSNEKSSFVDFCTHFFFLLQERRVIFLTVIQWKRMVWQRCRKRMFEQNATLTHDTNLLRHCFCTWTRMVKIK